MFSGGYSARARSVSSSSVGSSSPLTQGSLSSERERKLRLENRRRRGKMEEDKRGREEREKMEREGKLRERKERVYGGMDKFKRGRTRVGEGRGRGMGEDGTVETGKSYYNVDDGTAEGGSLGHCEVVTPEERSEAKGEEVGVVVEEEDGDRSVISEDSLGFSSNNPPLPPAAGGEGKDLFSNGIVDLDCTLDTTLSSACSLDEEAQATEDITELRRLRMGGRMESIVEGLDLGVVEEREEGEVEEGREEGGREESTGSEEKGADNGYAGRMMRKRVGGADGGESVVSSLSGCSYVGGGGSRRGIQGKKMVQSKKFGVGFESEEVKKRKELIRRQKEYAEKMKVANRRGFEREERRRRERMRKHREDQVLRDRMGDFDIGDSSSSSPVHDQHAHQKYLHPPNLMETQRFCSPPASSGKGVISTGLTRTEEELMRSLARLDFRLDEKKIAVDVMSIKSERSNRGRKGWVGDKGKKKKKDGRNEPPPLPFEVGVRGGGGVREEEQIRIKGKEQRARQERARQERMARERMQREQEQIQPPPPPAPVMSTFLAPPPLVQSYAVVPPPRPTALVDSTNKQQGQRGEYGRGGRGASRAKGEMEGGNVYVGEGIHQLVTPKPNY